MTMRLYDTAKQAVLAFEPGPIVTMYTCGITPYDATHLGHAATFLAYDTLQRRLIDLGHETRCVRNITDVDDPLLVKANQIGIHYLDLAAAEVARFEDDMDALGMLPVWSAPRATSAIGEIRKVVADGLMPPWFAATGAHSPWKNDRSLVARDKADFLAWLGAGKPSGDPQHAPPQGFPDQSSDSPTPLGPRQ